MAENPRIVGAIVGALRFRNAAPENLRSLSDLEWHELIEYADLSHLTLPLGVNCRSYLPEWVGARIDENLRDNCKRWELIKASYEEVRSAFISSDVQHVVLKGFAQCPDYAPSPNARFQSDIDLYCPDASMRHAVEALRQLEYEPVAISRNPDHLPVMIRRGDWNWRGNSYDPEMPPSIELHHLFWNRERMRLGPSDLKQFWSRRTGRSIDNLVFPALNLVDNLGFSALQVLRDLLNGALSAHKVYELAYFLHHKANDHIFWRAWGLTHDPDLRSCEAVSFCLAETCFHCNVAPQVAEQIANLPRTIRAWMPKYGQGSLTTHRTSEKDGLWVHLALVDSVRDKWAVLLRTFLRTPDPQRMLAESASVQGGGRWMQYAFYGLKRVPRHAWSIPRMLYHGGRILVASRRVGRNEASAGQDAELDLERTA
jgi:hypothetical protein